MTRSSLVLILVVAAGALLLSVAGASEKNWRRKYEGDQARGRDVIALWQFLPDAELEDSSSSGILENEDGSVTYKGSHHLSLRGQRARVSENGMFGSCLESFVPEHPSNPGGAYAVNHPELTPEGAFTVELWVRPKSEFFDRVHSHLIDKKYVSDDDYALVLRRRRGETRIVASLGFGDSSKSYKSQPIKIKKGKWNHITFTYDGSGGGCFYLNQKSIGRTVHEGVGSLSHGKHPLVIGDRRGANYGGFAGFIDQVRIIDGKPVWLADQ
jgi:hypothetical protein